MIQIENLRKLYGKKRAVEIGSLSIKQGECVGLVGNNGAGKTTLLRLILDLIRVTDGLVYSKEKKVAMSEHWKKYTGAFLDENFLISFLKPKEYLEFICKLNGLSNSYLDDFLAENKSIFSEDILDGKRLIRDLSKGNKNKVGILGAMINNPELLILDEPFANLDPTSQQWLMYKIKAMNEKGTTAIVSSHNLNQISEISSRIILLENGKLIKDTSNSENTLDELEDYFKVQMEPQSY